MKKWKKRLIWLGSSLIVLLTIGYLGMNLAMSYVLQSMIPQVPIEINELAEVTDSWKGATTNTNGAEQAGGSTDASAVTSGSASKQGEGNIQAAQSQPPATKLIQGTSKNNESVVSPNGDGASVATETGQATKPFVSKDKLGYEAQVSTEKTKAVEDAITLKEKATVTSVLLKKLSASDLQLFAKMAGNGLSVEEKKKAKAIILQKLSEDEYNQLIGIAAKYGLSQGKSYNDSKKK